MYEDEPQDRVHDVLGEAVFGSHPLGRRVIGDADVIASIPVPEIDAYHKRRYVASNLVVGAAGHLDHAQVVELVEGHLSPPPNGAGAPADAASPEPEPQTRFYRKDTEQYHICFGGPGLSRDDERRFALAVLDSIFGGATSSRLFREVREKRGLAYSVGSYTEQYTECGMVGLYVGTREENVAETCEIVGRELGRLQAEGVSVDELERAREHVKGRMVLGLEATTARMSRIARAILYDVPLLSLDEMLARVGAVTQDDLAELAAELYDPTRLSAACVGSSEERFREAVAPVSEALATT